MLDRREIARLALARPRSRVRHHPALRRDHIAGPQRRIVLDADRRETERVLAVAGALRHYPLAIEERVLELGITFPVGTGRIGDFAAEKDRGLAARTERPAQFAGRGLRPGLDRKIAAVAQAHAIGALARRAPIAAFPKRHVFRPAEAEARRPRCVAVMTKAAEQEIEQPLRGSAGGGRHD